MASESSAEEWFKDFRATLVPPVILLLIYYFGPAPERLMFDVSNPSLKTAWLASYSHNTLNHLVANVVGYLLAVLPTLWIFGSKNRHREFRMLILSIFVILPGPIAMANYIAFNYIIGVSVSVGGFASIVGGYCGALFAAVILTIYEEIGLYRAALSVTFMIFISLFGILYSSGHYGLVLNVLFVVGLLSFLSGIIPWNRIDTLDDFQEAVSRNLWTVVTALYGSSVVIFLATLLFPSDWIYNGKIVNIFANFAGLLCGIIIGAAVALSSIYKTEILRGLRRYSFKRKEILSQIWSELYVHKFYAETALAITAAAWGYLASGKNTVVAAATVFYATMLYFSSQKDRAVLRLESFEAVYINDESLITVEAEVKNATRTPAASLVSKVKVYDPDSDRQTKLQGPSWTSFDEELRRGQTGSCRFVVDLDHLQDSIEIDTEFTRVELSVNSADLKYPLFASKKSSLLPHMSAEFDNSGHPRPQNESLPTWVDSVLSVYWREKMRSRD